VIPYGRQSINLADIASVIKQLAFKSLTQGSKITEFEELLASYVGAKYAVAVSSATAGLHLAVMALDLPGDAEIITSPISFVASANAILYSRHRPNFIDIEKKSLNLDINLVRQEVDSNNRVKAIIPVHFAGLPCDMRSINELSLPKNIKIIEDAAHALGASYSNGSKVGSCKYSDMTVFSFHPVKSITTGEGGMITTNSFDLYKKLLRLRSHGINKLDDEFQFKLNSTTDGVVNPWYYEMQELGFNYRLTEVQAALGISQFRRLDRFIAKRAKRVSWYRKAISGSNSFRPAQTCSTLTSAHHIFPIRINFTKSKVSKTQLINLLKENGIGSQVHYIPIPLQPYYQKLGYSIETVPEAMSYYHDCLTLPLYPRLRKSQKNRIVTKLNQLLSFDGIN
jgi:UDP-4-amino-4,6-dideoxy-N-acetyl-beta-L-altrosamine transaminase